MKLVGIDPGVLTGFAVWDALEKKLLECKALPIHRALEEVDNLNKLATRIAVIFEDARQRTWFGNADARQAKYGAAIREGVGSVKRDCAIWQEFLTDRGIPYAARKPLSGGTKWPAVQFARVTGWQPKTNEHGRDAGMLVYGLPHSVAESIWIEHANRLEAGKRAHTATGT
jgi:hypothetical protein